MKTKGLRVSIYSSKDIGNCSNGGISSKYDNLIFVDAEGPFEGTKENSVRLVRRKLWGKEYLHAEPIEKPEGMVGPMAGGCFIYSSDSRFREVSKYPIPLHDRFETPEQYKHLST